MGKPHIWGLLLLFLAACTSVPGAGPEPEAGVPAVEINEPPGSAQPAEPEAAAPKPEQVQHVQLDDLGPAPELNNEVWLNTPGPLRLADLRGRVVLLDMWTFG